VPLLTQALRCFEEAARQGGIRRAAERLSLTPSAVNRQILNLESELGLPLFERLPRGLRLSSAGEMMLHRIRLWRREERQLRETLEAMRGPGSGTVRMAVGEALSEAVLPSLLEAFRRESPRASFAITLSDAEGVLRALADGTADLGACFNPAEPGPARVVRRFHFPMGAVVAPSHPLATAARPSLRDCAAWPAILPDASIAGRWEIAQAVQAAGVNLVTLAECNRVLPMRALARAGLGVAYLSRLDVLADETRGELVWRPLDSAPHSRTALAVCVPTDRRLPALSEALLERLLAALATIAEPVSRPPG